MNWKTVPSWRWVLALTVPAVFGWAAAAASCKPSGGGPPKLPAGFDLTCRTTGDGYPWEGSTEIETGLDDIDVTVFDTGRTEVDLSEQAGLVWDSFLAHDPDGGFADAVYGHGAFLRNDQRLSKTADGQAVLNDGGTLVQYDLVENGVYAPVEDDGSRLTFEADGTARLKRRPQVYEIFVASSLPSIAGDNPVLVAQSICAEPDCTGAHTTITTDDTSRIRSVKDPLGYVTKYDYDGNGRLQTITFPDGRVETLGYDGGGNLSTLSYAPVMGGAAAPTRTFTYVGWKLSTARGPGNGAAMPQATFSIDDSGRLESLEPVDHDKTTMGYQADTPKPGFTTVTLTNRTHVAGQNPVVMVDDPCAVVEIADDQKYVLDIGRDSKHRVASMTDPDNPAKNEAQIEGGDSARDGWGYIKGTIDDELGEKFVLAPTDEDGLEGRPASSVTGPEGTKTIVYAKDDPAVKDLPSWAIDMPSDESTTTGVVDDQGQMNALTLGTHHTYANTTDPSCPRSVVDTDKLTGLSQTTCISADGLVLLSVTDAYGLKTQYSQTDDPVKGETRTTTLPDGTQKVDVADPLGRPLMSKTMGYGDEEDLAYYGNGAVQARRAPGANAAGGFGEEANVDPETLLDNGDAEEDGTSAVENETRKYYGEGLPKEVDDDYSNAGGIPVGLQSFYCPWWAPKDGCQ